MSRSDLEAAVLNMVESLPRSSIDAAAASAERASANDAAAVVGAIAHPTYQQEAGKLVSAWRTAPDMTGEMMASLLRVAAAMRERAISEEQVDVVWTGPGTHEVPSRST